MLAGSSGDLSTVGESCRSRGRRRDGNGGGSNTCSCAYYFVLNNSCYMFSCMFTVAVAILVLVAGSSGDLSIVGENCRSRGRNGDSNSGTTNGSNSNSNRGSN